MMMMIMNDQRVRKQQLAFLVPCTHSSFGNRSLHAGMLLICPHLRRYTIVLANSKLATISWLKRLLKTLTLDHSAI